MTASYSVFFKGGEVPRVHSGWRYVELTKRGRVWAHLRIAGRNARMRIRAWESMPKRTLDNDISDND